MSKTEIALIILTIIGAITLYGWQTYRMSTAMLASPAKETPAASGTVQKQ